MKTNKRCEKYHECPIAKVDQEELKIIEETEVNFPGEECVCKHLLPEEEIKCPHYNKK